MSETEQRLAVETPIGTVLVEGDEHAIHRVLLPGSAPVEGVEVDPARVGAPLAAAAEQLHEYFAGGRREFDLPLEAQRGTPFQREVWRLLGEIPYGQTASYAEIAERAGRPRACRAVGQANGANPLAIVRPCHRVLASGGRIGGFGGGVEMKRALLDLEGVAVADLRA